MDSSLILKKNRTALALIILAAVLILLLLSLPAYRFDAGIYTKKSSNTFVGDEKYNTVLAEVNAIADDYRQKGMDVTVSETVTERTNSKGEVTSLITFTVNQEFSRNGWSFLTAGFPSSVLLMLLLACVFLSLACAVTGTFGSLGDTLREMDTRSLILRSAAIWFAVIALILLPVFIMMNTVYFSRKLTLYSSGILTEGAELYYQKMNLFLFNGAAGEDPASALKGLTFTAQLPYGSCSPACLR